MPADKCLLCDLEAELILGHVLPAFVYRWLRESSGNGFLRSTAIPNKRSQDGEKRYWFCLGCEQKFSTWEKTFAERLFHPYLNASGGRFGYANWLPKFCASVSWRVLRYYLDEGHIKDWEPREFELARAAEQAWREYLRGDRLRPGLFRLHMLPVDQISNVRGGALAPFINRYLMRAVQMDVLRGGQRIFTLAKLGRFVILGTIHEPNPEHWRGTEVNLTSGQVRPRSFQVPAGLLGYFNEKAHKSQEILASLSQRQKDKIDATFRANIDRLAGSDSFAAMNADVEMFGDDAFTSEIDQGAI